MLREGGEGKTKNHPSPSRFSVSSLCHYASGISATVIFLPFPYRLNALLVVSGRGDDGESTIKISLGNEGVFDMHYRFMQADPRASAPLPLLEMKHVKMTGCVLNIQRHSSFFLGSTRARNPIRNS